MNDPRERNAMELTFKAVFGVTTIPTALGLRDLPESLEKAQPVLGHLAVAVLCIGLLLSAAGIMWRDRDDGLAIQMAGLGGVISGSLFYAAALVAAGNAAGGYSNSAIASGAFLGISLGGIARFRQLRKYVKSRQHDAQEAEDEGGS